MFYMKIFFLIIIFLVFEFVRPLWLLIIYPYHEQANLVIKENKKDIYYYYTKYVIWIWLDKELFNIRFMSNYALGNDNVLSDIIIASRVLNGSDIDNIKYKPILVLIENFNKTESNFKHLYFNTLSITKPDNINLFNIVIEFKNSRRINKKKIVYEIKMELNHQ